MTTRNDPKLIFKGITKRRLRAVEKVQYWKWEILEKWSWDFFWKVV